MKSFLLVLGLLVYTSTAYGFMKDGCGSGNCLDCHSLNREEAAVLLKGKVDNVLSVKISEVPGLWALEAVFQGKTIPLYLDFSKKFIFSGNVIRLQDGEPALAVRLPAHPGGLGGDHQPFPQPRRAGTAPAGDRGGGSP